jgi:ABC-type nitrate/sulfonate/bicarbonate transport system permease component
MSASARVLWIAGSVAVTALLVLSWQLIADYGGIPPVFLPGPNRAWGALVSGFDSGELTQLTSATVERMIYGWVLASLAGIAIGALIGSSRIAREYVAPMLEIVRPVPVSAFMPVVMAFLGLTGTMVLVVIAIGSIWPVLLDRARRLVGRAAACGSRSEPAAQSPQNIVEDHAPERASRHSGGHAHRPDGGADPGRHRRDAD